tara:strand:- start:62 stop:1741 length:1680 start_codon:yes stop_codon:yes gene_type:complete
VGLHGGTAFFEISTSFSAKPNNLTLKKIRAAYYSDMNMKKYIAGSFDSLRIRDLKRQPCNNKLKINTSTKNLTFAQFLQNKIKLTCKNLTRAKGKKLAYHFTLTKKSIQEILNYCGEYIVNHQDMVNKFCENENITKPNYKKHIDDRDYLAGIFDSIMNFNLHRGSGKSTGRYNYYVKLIKFSINSKYVTNFLINNDIPYNTNTSTTVLEYALYDHRAKKLIKLILQNLISKKEITTEFINLPQKVDLATGDLFKEKIQFKIHPSITPKKGLTIEQSVIEAQKRKAAREKQKQEQKEEEKYFKEYREFLLALYNEQKKESKAYALQKKQKLRKAQEKQARKQAKLDKINSTHRFCKRCNTEKPKTEFYANPKILYGCDNVCKKCRIKEHSQYYAQNTEKCIASAKNWRKNNPDKVRAYNVSTEQFNKKFRELAETHNFTFFTGRGVKKQEYDKYLEQEYLKLPQKIKEDYNLPQILSAKEIFDLRSKSILHFDHIFPKAYIYREVEQGQYENYTISPHIYKNLRPFPGKLNESRLDKLEYLDYYSESELQDKKNAVFKL